MEFQDKSLRCVDCGSEFIWTAGEQLFFADKQFKNEPKRCKTCKAKRANRASRRALDARSGRDPDHLLGVREGHDGAVPSHAGTSGLLQGVLPAAEVRRRRRRLIVRTFSFSSTALTDRTQGQSLRCLALLSRLIIIRGPMQIEERSAGDVTILDLKGKMTLGEGDETAEGQDQQPAAAGPQEDRPEPGRRAVHRQRRSRRDRRAPTPRSAARAAASSCST